MPIFLGCKTYFRKSTIAVKLERNESTSVEKLKEKKHRRMKQKLDKILKFYKTLDNARLIARKRVLLRGSQNLDWTLSGRRDRLIISKLRVKTTGIL